MKLTNNIIERINEKYPNEGISEYWERKDDIFIMVTIDSDASSDFMDTENLIIYKTDSITIYSLVEALIDLKVDFNNKGWKSFER